MKLCFSQYSQTHGAQWHVQGAQ